MSSHREAIVTAALLTLLLVFPTASQDIKYTSTDSDSNTESPIVSTESTTDTQIQVNSEDSSTITVEKHDTLYSIEETPHQRVEKLETPEADLTIKKTNNTEISRINSPYGTFEKGLKNGKKYSDFEGLNKTRLSSKMSEMKNILEKYRSMARDKMLPDIEITISKEKANEDDERLLIENKDTESIQLKGWKIENSDGDTYTFEDLDLPARTTLEVYTATEEELNVTESTERLYIYGTGTDWDYYSDEAFLYNFEGEKISKDSY